MKKNNWKLICLILALGLTLTACGDEPEVQATPTPPPTPSESQPAEVTPTPSASPSPSAQQTQEADEKTADPLPTETTPPPPPEPAPIVGLMSEGEPVEEEWFADAAFVGDSRTDGLKLYSGIKGASFFSYKGLSVFNIDDQECIPLGDTRVTALDALSRSQYKKVYIMLGINELGYKDIEAFRQAYSDLVAAVKECQPEADIYVQLQPPVNETVASKSGMSAHITNERVHLFNAEITKVSEEHETALVNVWEALATEDGELPAEITSDGVHMKVKGYKIWYDYLRSHTGTTEPVSESGESADQPAQESGAASSMTEIDLNEIKPPIPPSERDKNT